ncbi:MAG: sulfatase [Planctomycetaceae bacterium]|jgi:uncharacterized sulfatase|nr:sulfatase [Planctomycetaceae bacterium]
MKLTLTAICLAGLLTAISFAAEDTEGNPGPQRPNILWLTCEDTGPHLGCYHFPTAETPNLDHLAERGTRYRFVWSNYPVCAPARTTIITGCYAAAFGAEQMRSQIRIPQEIDLFPSYLRQAGYYCTNNAKTDYNVYREGEKDADCWNECHNKAHWKNRPQGTPFFAVFNFTVTHESQIRNPHELKRDPEKTPVPAYHPNVPEVRHDWAQYHDRITEMDALCGEKLIELAEAGLAGDTIIFFFGDHGSGMPRNKRTPLDSGLHVPFLAYYPPKFRHLAPEDDHEKGVSERLISFVDLAPTVLSLAGIKPPSHMQGIPFAGKYAGKPRKYLFGFRGRMDERHDLVRSVTDGRYVYVRNYHPEIIYGAHNDYMFQTRTTQVWRELYDQKKLPPEQAFFWELKPAEELYDLSDDPDEIVNLADSPEHRAVKSELQTALYENLLAIRDLHFLPESMMHERSTDSTPYETAQDETKYPIGKIFDAANSATDRNTPEEAVSRLLSDVDSAVRYWGAIGILVRLADTAGSDGTSPSEETAVLYQHWKSAIERLLCDENVSVQTVAAEISGRFGGTEDMTIAAKKLVEISRSESLYTVWEALSAIDTFVTRYSGFSEEILTRDFPKFTGRAATILPKMMKSLKNRWNEQQ